MIKCEQENVALQDRDVLRHLADEKMRVAQSSEQAERKLAWQRHNDLQDDAPWMLYSYEIPWNEMNVDGELNTQCKHPFLRSIEWGMRQELYQWKHLSDDIVIEPFVDCPLAVSDDGFGLEIKQDLIAQSKTGNIQSHHYIPQLRDESDLAKLRETHVVHDEQESRARMTLLEDVFEGMVAVKPQGPKLSAHLLDELSTHCGIQELLMDLALRPEFVHAAVRRYLDLLHDRLDQYIALNVLTSNVRNVVFGYGSYGYTSHLPAKGFDPDHVRPCDCWTSMAPQIFTEVSPDMHEEFALTYEKEWMQRFGLAYYGCCGRMHHKIELLRKHIPNLRKISCSPWSNPATMAEVCGQDFVVSLKPNPAFLAEDTWRPDIVRADLEEKKEKLQGARVEVLIKDISTVRKDPRRLWEWSRIAREVFKK